MELHEAAAVRSSSSSGPLTSLWVTPVCALTLFLLLVISGTAVATPRSNHQEWPVPGVSLLRCTYVWRAVERCRSSCCESKRSAESEELNVSSASSSAHKRLSF